jgi:phosphosulfolactate synthase
MSNSDSRSTTTNYLRKIGVLPLPPRTSPFDPGYDPGTLEGHLDQSAHLMSILKISMACWIIASESVTRRKLAAARRAGIPTVAGGGPFEIAVVQGTLPEYLDLCADLGFNRIECGQGFTSVPLDPPAIAKMAHDRGLEIQFELGSKHAGPFTKPAVDRLIGLGWDWLNAGATELVVEARESARAVGLFGVDERFNAALADELGDAFGLDRLCFEAPTKASQFTLLDHFGRDVRLCNIRLEELLRVEIYRRGLHSDAFARENLRPAAVAAASSTATPVA